MLTLTSVVIASGIRLDFLNKTAVSGDITCKQTPPAQDHALIRRKS